ncbi:MAG: alpha/beta hydrolase [Porphyrobacter sp.]|jgi:acetyl esterase/lipase|nr:alpha/beta hydrolase [Porphyrobacter sp.]
MSHITLPPLVRVDPPSQAGEIPLYPDKIGETEAEQWNSIMGELVVRNVVRPTLTPFLPEPKKATGAAVIVLPGGGYQFLSLENEGWPVAKWLAERGIAAFVLKYRLNRTNADDAAFGGELMAMMAEIGNGETEISLSEPRAVEDAVAAIDMVRDAAATWSIDPARVGLLGFSAGAITALKAVIEHHGRMRPAFLGYIYGAMARVNVPADAPPMFAALALDDPLFGSDGFGLVEGWRAAGVPVELHAYEAGGHGYGMGRAGTTTSAMMDQFFGWLRSRSIVST